VIGPILGRGENCSIPSRCGCHRHLTALAEALAAPVATTVNGRASLTRGIHCRSEHRSGCALTVAYDILIGGCWRLGTNVGAVAAMAVGTIVTLATMIYLGDIYANDPVFYGLASGLMVFVVGSLTSTPTDPEVLAEWDRRSRGQSAETVPTPVT
jgi:Na+/proline symporter